MAAPKFDEVDPLERDRFLTEDEAPVLESADYSDLDPTIALALQEEDWTF